MIFQCMGLVNMFCLCCFGFFSVLFWLVGFWVLGLVGCFFYLFPIASIFSMFYHTSRVMVGKERRKPSRLQFVKEGMESGRCDCLGNCVFLGVNLSAVPQVQALF